jgi:hypothetical protein
VDGPDILVRTLSTAVPMGPSRNPWQYHSRSDRHSKVACWGVFFDLLQHSAVLREHVSSEKVVFGLNHSMTNFVNDKRKKLDLVIAQPGTGVARKRPRSSLDLMDQQGLDLTAAQRLTLASLPVAVEGPVGAVLVAMEAKACATAHGKSLPRLFDELNSSHQIVHASSNRAISVGFAMINAATTFISPALNPGLFSGAAPVVSHHSQPGDAARVVETVQSLPRRSRSSGEGYDGLAIVVVDLKNDGTPVGLVTEPPAPPASSALHYDAMIRRVANEYDVAFRAI